jgi:hypothetical protein
MIDKIFKIGVLVLWGLTLIVALNLADVGRYKIIIDKSQDFYLFDTKKGTTIMADDKSREDVEKKGGGEITFEKGGK